MALFTFVFKAIHVIQDHEEHYDALFGIDRGRVGLIDFFLGRSKHIRRKA